MRLIDADALIKKIFPYDGVDKKAYTINAKMIYEEINKAPTIDIKTEVAREIFEEIEKVATINLHTGEIKITYPDYIKFKNKYTKEGVGE